MAYFWSSVEPHLDEDGILSKPFELGLDWGAILEPGDSERCNICDEIKPPSISIGKIDENLMFFCSKQCLHNSWDNVVQIMKGQKRFICSLPGCIKPCAFAGNKRHDYCTVSHHNDHYYICRQLFYCNDLVQCKLPGCDRLCPKVSRLDGYCCKKHKQTTIFCALCSQTRDPVKFYNSDDPFYEFSNFYEFAPFTLDDKKWKTSEHYFQAQKFLGTPYEEVIRNCESPRKALDLSRKYHQWERGDWERAKLDVMYLALLAKFSAHEQLRLLLCSTGDRKIIEHSLYDSFWGDGGGNGKNHLGELLMKVRRAVRESDLKK